MTRPWPVTISLALAGALYSAPAQAIAPDHFTQAHTNAVAANPKGVTLHLSLDGDRKTFHRGEPIPVTLSFTCDKPKAFQLYHWNIQDVYTFVFDPEKGVIELTSYPNKIQIFNPNTHVPDPIPLSKIPARTAALLNDEYRFDSPGHYRIFAVTDTLQQTDSVPAHSQSPVSVASDIAELDILPNDPVWEASQLNDIKSKLQSNNEAVKAAAQRDLTFLCTNDAVTEILRLLKDSPRHPEQLINSLADARDQHFVVRALRDTLSDPDFAVSDPLLKMFELRDINIRYPFAQIALERDPGKALQKQRELMTIAIKAEPVIWGSYLRALQTGIEAKHGHAKAVSIITLLTNSAKGPHAVLMDATHRRRMADTLHSSLPVLSESEQSQLLSDPCWPVAKYAHLGKFLERASRLDISINGNHDTYRLRNAALRRLLEVRPKAARNIILNDIRSGDPKIDTEILEMLPDTEIPSLDPVFKKYLTPQEWTNLLYSDLVYRYATRALERHIKSIYPELADTESNLYLLSYFLRVDEPYGRRMINRSLLKQLKEDWGVSLLSSLVFLNPTPAVKRIVRAHLHDRHKGIAYNARVAFSLLKSGKRVKHPMLPELSGESPWWYP